MSWTHLFTRNWSDLSEDATDPSLRPLELSRPPAEAVPRAAALIEKATRWKVLEFDPGAGTLHATHTTALWRFVDDIHLTFRPHGSGSQVVGQSRSRIGKGDLGKNAQNLRELKQILKENG